MNETSSAPVLCSVDKQGVAHLTLNRVEKHNAFDANMIEELRAQIERCEHDPQVRVLWLKTAGKHFCAGADLNWMKASINFSAQENIDDAVKLGQLMHQLYHCTKPTIATIQGACYGGGIGLVACCKIALTTQQAHFCFSEVKLGLIPAVISPFIIEAMGVRRTQACFLSAEVFTGQQAYEWGLCYEAVSEEMLQIRAENLVQALVQNSPHALQATHQLMNSVKHKPLDQALLNSTAKIIADIRASEEGQEGLNAFLEKRKPSWQKES